MSTRKKPSQPRLSLPQQILKSVQTLTKGLVNWLLRSLLILKRTSRLNPGGFVLPTVVMVMLVVILITTAILFRSFDRSKNASNYRVNEAVLNAASPALDRAKAKLEQLFSTKEQDLPSGTPTEADIAQVIEAPRYTFGDETQLKLVSDFNNNGISTPSPDPEPEEKLRSAWKFPVDTDNNGKFDSFTLYGIYFRTPPTDSTGNLTRPRKTLEARGLPQDSAVGNDCYGSGESGGGWTEKGGKLKKAFFVYVANVPITNKTTATAGLTATEVAKYEQYKGNKGFSGLEMQQDQARIALDNNAVWYEDDLAILNATTFRLNGRVHTNSNLLVKAPTQGSQRVMFLEVSSPYSCFYDEIENSKIEVGGNVANGGVGDTADSTSDLVRVDLYNGAGAGPNTEYIKNTNKSVNVAGGQGVAYNNSAYDNRIGVMTQGGISIFNTANGVSADQEAIPSQVNSMARFPQVVKERFAQKYDLSNPDSDLLRKTLETYFRERTRRVPYAEVPINDTQNKALGKPGSLTTTLTSKITGNAAGEEFVFSSSGVIIPPTAWMLIEDPATGAVNNYTNVPLRFTSGTLDLEATDPELVPTGTAEREFHLGDRIRVGNSLPTIWERDSSGQFVQPEQSGKKQEVKNGATAVKWNDTGTGATTNNRERTSQVAVLDDLGDTNRAGFWEKAAATQFIDPTAPTKAEDLAGGLRIVTGAGIFVDGIATSAGGTGQRSSDTTPTDIRSFLPKPPDLPSGFTLPQLGTQNNIPNPPRVVWPDTMPMWEDTDRDNVVDLAGTATTPPQDRRGDLQMRATVVYHYKSATSDFPIACIGSYYDPTNALTAAASDTAYNGEVFTFNSGWRAAEVARLRNQASLVYPDGRLVNAPLRKALQTRTPRRTIADKAAIDSAVCALRILGIGGTAGSSTTVPDEAIKETSFLDARQLKALHKKIATALTTDNPQRTTDQPNPNSDLSRPEGSQIAETATELEALTPTATDLPQYSLAIEQRQPTEIRVTEIDLNALRGKTIGSNTGAGIENNQEYLLPNSGIIYASRDDAIADQSNAADRNKPTREEQLVSGTDFKLDPTRRPNGIRLINGSNLSRVVTYRRLEKGLTLATNLPVYIKGAFNLHRTSDTGTTQIEEFTLATNFPDATGVGNFYQRGSGGEPERVKAYGKRQNQPGYSGGATSDRWRPARILADSVTLLSDNFKDGYRVEGDFDLRNNIGNSAVEARLKNGFWWNSFATSRPYWNTTANTLPNAAAMSSYLTNGVTPVQRRVKALEYQMEICLKLPVSECNPLDWKETQTVGAVIVKAGTTATPIAATPATFTAYYQRFPRRVAFERDSANYGTLKVSGANNSAKPRGINNSGAAYTIDYSSPVLPRQSDNALWFWSTSNNTNPSSLPLPNQTSSPTYAAANLLYYPAPDLEVPATGTTVSEKQLLLPGTPKFPASVPVAANSLNGATATDPSDYAACISTGTGTGKGVTTALTVTTLTGTCPTTTATNIQTVRTTLAGLVAGADTSVGNWTPPTPGTASTLTASKKVNVYNMAATGGIIPNNTTLTLDRGSQSNPIFIIRMPTGVNTPLTFGSTNTNVAGVTLKLQGVDPNNVFWVSNAGMRFNNVKNTLAGNFLGNSTASTANTLRIVGTAAGVYRTKIPAGRFLGFSGLFTGKPNPAPGVVASTFPDDFLVAMTTIDEPTLVPVLNLHSPLGSPNVQRATAFGDGSAHLNGKGDDPNTLRWVQQASADTTFNAVFVVGDSPTRPIPASTFGTNIFKSESGGGLPNFLRFLEVWETQENAFRNAFSTGSFIQPRKSLYATGPFESVDVPTVDNSLFFDGTSPDYKADYTGIVNYQYRGGASGRLAPYFRPPNRAWGYDVALLSQSQDLFSRRFATPTAGIPNEFFREVGRDDPWIQALLCAAQGSGTSYSRVLPASDIQNCPALASYND